RVNPKLTATSVGTEVLKLASRQQRLAALFTRRLRVHHAPPVLDSCERLANRFPGNSLEDTPGQLSLNCFKCLMELERAMGFEPTTPTLARLCSTPELHPRSCPHLRSCQTHPVRA